MDARDSRPMNLNPLLGESGVVNVSDIKMNANERAVHIIEKCPEFPGCQQEALFRVTIFAADFNLRLCCERRQLPHGVQAALVDLVVGNFLSNETSKAALSTLRRSSLTCAFVVFIPNHGTSPSQSSIPSYPAFFTSSSPCSKLQPFGIILSPMDFFMAPSFAPGSFQEPVSRV